MGCLYLEKKLHVDEYLSLHFIVMSFGEVGSGTRLACLGRTLKL